MARKSRKTGEQAVETVFRVGIYVRLSIEDCRDHADNEALDNQKRLLEQYVAEKPDLKLYQIYEDNGKTGTDFNRDGFNSMIDDLKKRVINCIIVKDLSRFARNAIEAGEYIERIFPFLETRFIAVNDGYDNFDSNCNSQGLIIPLKNMINELYAKDISKKIVTVLHEKQKRGEFIGAYAPYGYMRSEQDPHKLVIDEDTASIVKDIFRQRAEGVSYTLIARSLNAQKIPTPTQYRYQLGIFKKDSGRATTWQGQAIKKMVYNPIYIGHMAQGKTVKSFYDNMPTKVVPQSEWVIVENTHEPLIDKETYQRAQSVNEERHQQSIALRGKHEKLGKTENLFRGMIFCGDCGKKLSRDKDVTRYGKVHYSFICLEYETNRWVGKCKCKNVRENMLHDTVYQGIKSQIALAVDIGAVLKRISDSQVYKDRRQSLKNDMKEIQRKINRVAVIQSELYTVYFNKVFTDSEYVYMKENYAEQLGVYQTELAQLQETYDKQINEFSPNNKWITAFRKFQNKKILSREMITALIEKIVVYEKDRIDIQWRFNDSYLKVEKVGGKAK